MSPERAVKWVCTWGVLAAAILGPSCARRATEVLEAAPTTPPQAGSSAEAGGAPAAAATPAGGDRPTEPGPPSIQSRRDKLSYAFGVDMARSIQRQKDGLNVELLKRALLDALGGEKLVMTDGEVASTLEAFEADVKKDLEHARAMVSQRNRRESDAFFADNARKAGVVTLPSGLQYTVLKQGDGARPSRDDVVRASYRATLLDGTEVDGSEKHQGPAALPVSGMIPGVAQALQLMAVGSRWKVFVPPQLAYGDRAMPRFGPNSTLVFDLEVLSVQGKVQAANAAR